MIAKVHIVLFKGIRLIFALAILTCTAASCGPKKAADGGSRCAFADPEFIVSFRICSVAAEYYLAKHEWPTSRVQFVEQWRKMLDAEKEMSPENKESPDFFDQFTRLDLDIKHGNLVLHYGLKLDDKVIEQRIVLRPGSTADQIMQTATD
jgi:hypothetical protein